MMITHPCDLSIHAHLVHWIDSVGIILHSHQFRVSLQRVVLRDLQHYSSTVLLFHHLAIAIIPQLWDVSRCLAARKIFSKSPSFITQSFAKSNSSITSLTQQCPLLHYCCSFHYLYHYPPTSSYCCCCCSTLSPAIPLSAFTSTPWVPQ